MNRIITAFSSTNSSLLYSYNWISHRWLLYTLCFFIGFMQCPSEDHIKRRRRNSHVYEYFHSFIHLNWSMAERRVFYFIIAVGAHAWNPWCLRAERAQAFHHWFNSTFALRLLNFLGCCPKNGTILIECDEPFGHRITDLDSNFWRLPKYSRFMTEIEYRNDEI